MTGPKETVIRLEQMRLVSAISMEVARQYPGVTVNQDQFNAIIAAANLVKEAYDGTPVLVAPPADEDE
ncbi:hypothetical protein PQA73_gp35 [Erwinia phage Pavtok]|uniref:Uncharacterized protein n=1 Tax=Erwinia phage Pavtok TaxID=2267655 RepID=A0A345BLZ2_9CAUD|nr:hypothetical protein PQA73_gp35 [Erwinia phage Pavtok]AXF51463.1 hypothetical protein PAVTOK_35 [Erwinia phage Pavtok]